MSRYRHPKKRVRHLNYELLSEQAARYRMDDCQSEAINGLSKNLCEQREALIRRAISNHLGTTDWLIDDVKSRLQRISPLDGDIITITMDGEPIFAYGQVELDQHKEGNATMLHASIGYKVLNDPPQGD